MYRISWFVTKQFADIFRLTWPLWNTFLNGIVFVYNSLSIKLVLPIHCHISCCQSSIFSRTGALSPTLHTSVFIRQYFKLSVFFLTYKNRHTISSVSLNIFSKKLRSNRNYCIFLIFSMVRFYVWIKRTFYRELRHYIFPQGLRQLNPL